MEAHLELPHTEIQDYLGGPVERESAVEFRLLYSGRVLGASRDDSRVQLKHEIRREFHPQLRRLWQTHNNLRLLPQNILYKHDTKGVQEWVDDPDFNKKVLGILDSHTDDALFEQRFSKGIELITKNWERCGYKFVPLVTGDFCVRCSLDILFLRPEEPGLLIRSGDIDARIKTIFDALRMPTNLAETGSMGPQEGEDPFYCLLEDDKLISEIRVTTDQLLLLPREREIKPNDALLVIRVNLKSTQRHTWDWVFS